jgi:tRNA-dihydrouridine synthase B
MFQIGPYLIDSQVILAPMAGVTDRPFRQLCRRLGAGLVVSEMVTSNAELWGSRKSSLRMDHTGESEPIAVQIAGNDPQMMAEAACFNAANGAQIIDINMGCPAKKVCKKAAGSALLKDEILVGRILNAVVSAVDVPVTLKFRTGWSLEERNALQIAKIAEEAGITALALHGRTRACGFSGNAEYDTIAAVVQAVKIPVFCNGDIDSVHKAKAVLDHTQAAALMIGRAAQGRPWIFREIEHFLRTGTELPDPSLHEVREILNIHLAELYRFYGEFLGPRIARKHVSWYLQTVPNSESFRKEFNQIETAKAQADMVQHFFEQIIKKEELAA